MPCLALRCETQKPNLVWRLRGGILEMSLVTAAQFVIMGSVYLFCVFSLDLAPRM